MRDAPESEACPCIANSRGPAALTAERLWIKEMSASEPPMRCRNSIVDVETGVLCWFRDQHGRSLLIGRAASGIEVA